MPYKKGDKFTVEITEVLTGEDGKTVYRMNDFSSLVFDDYGLDRLEKVEPVMTKKKSSFSRVGYGNEYFTIQASGSVTTSVDTEGSVDCARFEVANYCTDKSLLEQRALHETLNRLLWRYSEEHGGELSWDGNNQHCFIYYDYSNGRYGVDWQDTESHQGVVYFIDDDAAWGAIDDVLEPFISEHPEFVW